MKFSYYDLGLLILRAGVGLLMLIQHGLPKLMSFSERADSFFDPFGIGSRASLILVIFAECFCSLLLIVGYKSRLASIPLIIAMAVAVFIRNAGESLQRRELGLIYLVIFLAISFLGSGKYSLDRK